MISSGPAMPSIMCVENQNRVEPNSRIARQRLRNGYMKRSSIAMPPANPVQ